MSLTTRRIASILLLIVGVQLWLVIGRSQWGSNVQLLALPIVLATVVAWLARD